MFGFYPASPDFLYEADYIDTISQRAAQRYAAAQARVQAIESQRQRQYDHRPRYMNYYSQPVHAPVHRAPIYSVEELAYSILREQERRQDLLARQRELEHARARAEAAVREEAARRARARLQAQQAQEQQLLLSILGLAAALAPSGPAPTTSQFQQAQCGPQYVPPRSVPTPRNVNISVPVPSSEPVDIKGKGKAVDIPTEAPPAPIPAPPKAKVPSFKEELEARIRSETDPDIQQSLLLLYSDIFDTPTSSLSTSQPVAGPSMSKNERSQVPITGPSPSSTTAPAVAPSQPAPTSPSEEPATPVPSKGPETPAEGADLQRTPALPPAVAEKLLKFYHARRARRLSLAQIKEVEEALRQLMVAFEFPDHLDFVNPIPTPPSESESESDEPGALAYTPNNTAVHAYEHALNGLLTKLDTVESNGDVEVRGRRKEVVKEVERALEAMDRRVEESRERERERSRERARRASANPADLDIRKDLLAASEDSKNGDVFEETTTATAAADPVVEAAPVTPRNDATRVEVEETTTNEEQSSADEPEPVSSPQEQVNKLSDPRNDHVFVNTGSDLHSELGDAPTLTNVVASAHAPTPVSGDDSSTPSLENPPEARPTATSDVAEDLHDPATVDALPGEIPASEATPDYLPPPASSSSPETVDDALLVLGDPPITPAPVIAPEAISRIASTATDTTYLTAETDADTVPPSASDEPTFSIAETTSPIDVSEPATPATGTDQPMTRAPSSASSAGAETFLLSSTPLADDSEPKRRATHGAGEDEPEIISKEELEVARSDSDWDDLESDSDA